MIIENMFKSLFGIIWLITFVLSVLALLIWLFVKKEKVAEENKKVLIKYEYKCFLIEENESAKFEVKKLNEDKVYKIFEKEEDAKIFIDVLFLRSESTSMYEIVEQDGFYKVKKKGSERTVRKFNTEEEAEDYIKEKENND